MKTIPLSQGKVVLIDDDDCEYLNQWKWHAHKDKNTYYALRNERLNDGIRKTIFMHRVILKTPNEMQVDHIDHNGLNNQRSNIRNCTSTQNGFNKLPKGKSKYLGVGIISKGKLKGRIVAQININGRRTHLAVCKTEIIAATIYDQKAKEVYGEFANLNFR